jgi:hypothetical protein
MSKRLVGSLFPDFDRISLKPDRRLTGAFKRLQENAERSERFESEKALHRTAELALRDGHCAFAGKSA